MTGKHASLSASKTKEWGNCAAVIPLAEMFGEPDPSGRAAMMGTCVHHLIERCLGEGEPPSKYAGRLIELLDPDGPKEGVSILRAGAKMPTLASGRVVFLLDEDLVAAATCMVDYVVRRLVEVLPGRYTEEMGYAVTAGAVAEGHLRLESRTNPLPERSDTGGTADVTIDVWPDLLEVVDYKNGSGVWVPVERNPQLRSYLLGRAKEASGALADEYATYRIAICQPRHYRAPSGGVTYEEFDFAELTRFDAWLRTAAGNVDRAREVAQLYASEVEGLSAAGQDARPTVEGLLARLYEPHGLATVGSDGSHCEWCPAKARCPAVRDAAQRAAHHDFAEDPPEDVKATVAEEVGMMRGNSLAEVLPWLPFLRKYVEAVEARARAVLAAGEELPGWKLVQTQGDRAWRTDLEEAAIVDRLVLDFGADAKALFSDPVPPRLLSGPKVEKLLPAKRRKEFSEALLYRPSGGVKLVTEDDARPAYVPAADAASDFRETEDDFRE